MQTTVINPKNTPSPDFENFLTNCVMSPLGSMFLLPFGSSEKIQENTFEIVTETEEAITVCGDTLINLFLGKELLNNLKIQ